MRLVPRRTGYLLSVLAGLILIGLHPTLGNGADDRLSSIPASGKILFLSNRDIRAVFAQYRKEIYAMDENGGNVTRITKTKDHHYLFGVDKSGRYLVVSRADKNTKFPPGLGDEDRRNVWILDLVTKQETRLTPPENEAEADSFSPDSDWIVFFMVPKGKQIADIYKIRRDKTGLTNLTNTPNESDADPVWSNDGKRIAFLSIGPQTQGHFVLRVMDVDGRNVRTVYGAEESVATPRFPPGAYDPSWSPDDKWIVFSKPVRNEGENGNAGVWHICKIRPDGTGFVDLSQAGGHTDWAEYVPRFSPDGKSIVFNARYGHKKPTKVKIDVFVMDENGGSLRKLTDSSAVNDGAFWIE